MEPLVLILNHICQYIHVSFIGKSNITQTSAALQDAVQYGISRLFYFVWTGVVLYVIYVVHCLIMQLITTRK